jgi:hypothetical protein
MIPLCGLNFYGASGVKRFSLLSAQSSIFFEFLCSVGEIAVDTVLRIPTKPPGYTEHFPRTVPI